MNDKEEMRDRELLTLAKDQKYQQLLKELSYNWEICASRMDQITKERQVGLYDDTGVEVMAVFNRLERVGTLMLAIKNHPQAHLLKDFRHQLSKMNDDHRMDPELAALVSPERSQEMTLDTPTFWLRLKETYGKHRGRLVQADDGITQASL